MSSFRERRYPRGCASFCPCEGTQQGSLCWRLDHVGWILRAAPLEASTTVILDTGCSHFPPLGHNATSMV